MPHNQSIAMDFTRKLLRWYHQNGRNLPFRNTSNPYYIWLSEIILQQTRVNQGMDYYHRFVENYPTIQELAKAPEEDVLKLWQGLGYYSRARNLHYTAQYVVSNYGGKFPEEYSEILKLKGVGPYTAAAIASFAFKQPVATVDGNAFRLFARYFGIYDDIAKAKTRTLFQALGDEWIDKQNPDLFNHAVMDFGATVCKPQQPLCNDCVLQEGCFAYHNNEINNLPVKVKKIKIKHRYLHYLLIIDRKGDYYVNKRTTKGIWQGLYEFPLHESATDESIEQTIQQLCNTYQTKPSEWVLEKEELIHKLSHQTLHIYVWRLNRPQNLINQASYNTNAIKGLAFPIILWNEVVQNL